MPSNIEIKARAPSLARKHELAAQLADQPVVILMQEDTFFPCEHGRLKLRRLAANEAELIFYQRPNVTAMKQSHYSIFRTESPDNLLAVLGAALGAGVVVKKKRWLYRVDQTRIHLDEVEGLGSFIELEVAVCEGQSAREGRKIAERLMGILEIAETDLIDCAYADLLQRT